MPPNHLQYSLPIPHFPASLIFPSAEIGYSVRSWGLGAD